MHHLTSPTTTSSKKVLDWNDMDIDDATMPQLSAESGLRRFQQPSAEACFHQNGFSFEEHALFSEFINDAYAPELNSNAQSCNGHDDESFWSEAFSAASSIDARVMSPNSSESLWLSPMPRWSTTEQPMHRMASQTSISGALAATHQDLPIPIELQQIPEFSLCPSAMPPNVPGFGLLPLHEYDIDTMQVPALPSQHTFGLDVPMPQNGWNYQDYGFGTYQEQVAYPNIANDALGHSIGVQPHDHNFYPPHSEEDQVPVYQEHLQQTQPYRAQDFPHLGDGYMVDSMHPPQIQSHMHINHTTMTNPPHPREVYYRFLEAHNPHEQFHGLPPQGPEYHDSVSSPAESEILDSAEAERLQNTYRSDPLYKTAIQDVNGLYHCPFEADPSCNHRPDKLKCNYDKFVDSHLKPYRCKHATCALIRFSSTACQLRHEREAHALHGHGEKPFLCRSPGCERSLPGNGFPRQWNMRDHMRRVHAVDPGDHAAIAPKKRKSEGNVTIEARPMKRVGSASASVSKGPAPSLSRAVAPVDTPTDETMRPSPAPPSTSAAEDTGKRYGSLATELQDSFTALSDPHEREEFLREMHIVKQKLTERGHGRGVGGGGRVSGARQSVR